MAERCHRVPKTGSAFFQERWKAQITLNCLTKFNFRARGFSRRCGRNGRDQLRNDNASDLPVGLSASRAAVIARARGASGTLRPHNVGSPANTGPEQVQCGPRMTSGRLFTRINLFEGFEIPSVVQVTCGTGSALKTSAFGAKRLWADLLSARPGRS